MPLQKKRPNFLRINDPKLNKLFWWICAATLAIAVMVLVIAVAELISLNVSKPGQDISALFPRLYPFVEFVVGVCLILFIAFLTVVIYNYATNKEKHKEEQAIAKAESPLSDTAKGHEQQIIDLMISIIKPVPGKKTISQAKTAKFIKALKNLNLMDVNLEGQHLIPWIETVTGYSAGNTSAFNQAKKAVKVNDPDLMYYKSQIEEILSK